MAKSLRSKSRQKVLSVRRKKFRERERLKAWDHYRQIKAREDTSMQTGEQEATSTDSTSTEIIETAEQVKIPQKEIAKWASRNSKKRQKKRLKAQAKVKSRKTRFNNKNRRGGEKMEL